MNDDKIEVELNDTNNVYDEIEIELNDKDNIDIDFGEGKYVINFISGSYNDLSDKPKINDVTLENNKTSEELNLQDKMNALTNLEIEKLLNDFIGG